MSASDPENPQSGNGSPPSAGVRAVRSSSKASRAATSDLLGRADFSTRIGQPFNGRRDLDAALGYPVPGQLGIREFRARYERGGIAERIVEAYPRATWTGGAYLQEDPDPEIVTPFESSVSDLFDRLSVWSRLMRADILAGLGRYSVLVIGAEGAKGKSDQPLERANAESILYLSAYAEDKASIGKLVEDDGDARYGLPEFYNINAGNKSRKVHWTRTIHIAEGMLEDEVYGKPRLRSVWNYLIDLDKIIGGGSEASWNRADPGIHADVDPAYTFDDASAEALQDQFDEYRHKLRKFLLTRGLPNLKMLEGQPSAFGGNADAVEKLIAATLGCPARILFGSERGEQASTQDRNNWNDRISERYREFATPVTRALTDRFIEIGALPAPVDGYEVVWPEEDELTEDEKAGVASTLAAANKANAESGGGPILTADEIRDRVLNLPSLMEVLTADELELLDPEDVDGEGDDGEATTLRAAADLTTSPPDEPEWRSVHRAADANRATVARTLTSAWSEARADIDLTMLEGAIERGDIERADQIVGAALTAAHSDLRTAIEARILTTLVDGGQAALRSARSRGSWFRSASGALTLTPRSATLTMTFDAVNPRALAYAARRAADLIVEIGPDTLAAVRELIGRGMREGIAPRVLAQSIRDSVGLHSGQVRAVDNLIKDLRAAQPGATVQRFPPRAGVRDVAGYRARVPKAGASEEWIQRQAERYRSMQHNLRARTIARTETLRAANEGQRELWRQGVDGGQLPATVKRVLIATPDERLRDDHEDADGQIRGLDEPFDMGDGTTEPGQATNCRCAQGLATPEDIQRAVTARVGNNYYESLCYNLTR